MFRKIAVFCIVSVLVLGIFSLPQNQAHIAAAATCGTTNIALNKTATSSSNEAPGTLPAYAVDGNLNSRWSSAFSDPQWIQIDLGSTQSICQVILRWETAAGKSYQIQVSNDAATWTSIYSTTAGAGGVETLAVSGSGRYIRMYGTARTTVYGYSLWEFEVYAGTTSATNTNTPLPTNTNTPQPTNTNTLVPTNTALPTNTNTPVVTGCGTTNVALNKPATSSSNENAGTTPNLAVDGNLGTRWSSAFSDPQWIQIDLGSTQSICHVKLTWETAYGKAYQIQVSNDAATWTTIYSTTTGAGGVNDLTGLSGSGRYIRMYGTVRGTQYGYSIWEFEVYAGSTNTPTFVPPTSTNTPSPTTVTGCGTTNLALNKPATSSANENTSLTPNLAVDGNTGTRWSSAFSDPQWIQVDLGSTMNICHVKLTWETAYGKAYQIQVSSDAATWTTIYSTTTGAGGVNDLTGLSGSGRYIRMYGTVRGTAWGYSLWEFEVYGG